MKNMWLRFGIVLCGFSLFTSCAVNPVSGKKQVMLVSEDQELAMGKEADPQIIKEFGLYGDSELQRYMNQQGQAIAKISHRSNIPYQFRVLDSDVVNAFAVPGGYVYFTRGIMAQFNNEAQFAGVLGHEIGHITAKHGTVQQTNQTLAQLGLMVAVISDKRLAQFAETASQGLNLLFLKYSRNDESQSDELGVQYSSKIGFDAHEMATFFTTLQRQQSKSASTLPEFLSTHPDPGNRYTAVNKYATEYQATNKLTNLKINHNNYLKLIDNMIYGADPRQGYVENGIFYHPDLRIQFTNPVNWKYSNTPAQVTFAPTDGSAVFFLRTAAGNTAEEAAQTFVQGAALQVSESKRIQVNGLDAYMVVGDQLEQTQQGATAPAVRAMIYFIRYNNYTFMLAGASAPANFEGYRSTFQKAMNSFNTLTDAAHLNKKAERISIKTTTRAMSFQQALVSYGIPSTRFEEMAILNGKQLTDQLSTGSMIKIVD
jgi:predicted Zn-dependent protease